MGLFGVYALTTRESEDFVQIDAAEIAARVFVQEMRRGEPLTDAERAQVRQEIVEEKILVREAYAMGLEDDSRIHEILAQKMQHILSAGVIPPTQEELVSFHEDNAQNYSIPPRMTVDELVFDAGEPLSEAMRQQLQSGADPDDLTAEQPANISTLTQVTAGELENIFDFSFSQQAFSTPVGGWVGPFISNRGQHWLRPREKTGTILVPLDQIADRVRQDWLAVAEEQWLDTEMERLQQKYRVEITDSPSQ